MASARRCLALLLVASFAAAEVRATAEVARVTPLEKVISLIQGLKDEVEGEGKAEAQTYDDFACFCKAKTTSLSGDIKGNQDTIDMLSADIEADTAEKESKITEEAEQKSRKEQLTQDLQDSVARCAKEKAEYEASNADLTKAISSLTGAIKAMEDSKPSLLAVRTAVKENLALAEALQLIDQGPKWRSFKAFLQEGSKVDPQSPEFKYHSQDIINILNKLLSDFNKKKVEADGEWAKTDEACKLEHKDLDDGIALASKAIEDLNTDIDRLKEKIGMDRGNLVQTDAALKDNKLYLEDLTKMCEQRAKYWDQRSATRADELTALTKALTILTDDASEVESVNKRALLLQQKKRTGATAREPKAKGLPSSSPSSAGAFSFLQQQRQQQILRHAVRGATVVAAAGAATDKHAQGVLAAAAAQSGTGREARKARALATLREASGRLGSTALAALTTRAAADPFTKVKTLIQELIERLLSESTQEATKKGFCDKRLGETTQDRDYRMADVSRLTAEIIKLEAKEDELTLVIKELKEAIKKLQDDLTEAENIRNEEHAENLRTVQKAQEGKQDIEEAIDILTVFYKQAAKAAALTQVNAAAGQRKQQQRQLRASPVDEDTSGAGFEGSYKGKQTASEGILGILQVIKSDFERTIKVTNQEESDAQAKFVEFERASKADISGKTMTQTRSEEDLETATATKDSKMTDMKSAMNLVDSALQQLEDLKPLCIDSGMSYDDRVAKREEEIQALKTALCHLDEENAEPDCAAEPL